MSSVALIEELNPEHAPQPLAETAGAVQLLLDLEASGAVTPTSLTLPEDLDYDRYVALGTFLGALKSRSNFYLGDWLIFGEGTFAERWSQACEATGLAEQTLLRVMTVCRNVVASRRRERLSFSVHAAVSGLGAREQKAWLTKAERNGWGYAELRSHMKAARTEVQPPLYDEETPPHGEPDTALLLEAARSLVRNAEEAGENVIIRREDYARIKAALGEE